MANLRKSSQKMDTHSDSKLLGGVKALASAYAITAVVFMVAALLLTYTDLGEGMMPMIAACTTVVSSLAAGYVMGRTSGQKGLIFGLVMGGIYVALLFLTGFLAGSDMTFSLSKIPTIVMAVAGGGIGGIFGVNKK